MDDQRTNPEGDGVKMRISKKHFRFGLRLMLILVALVAVSTAWLRARHDVHRLERDPKRANIQARIEGLSIQMNKELSELKNAPNTSKQNFHTRNVNRIKKDIANAQKELSDLDE